MFQYIVLAKRRTHFKVVRIGSMLDPLWVEPADLREDGSIDDATRDAVRLRALDFLFTVLPTCTSVKELAIEQLYLSAFLRAPVTSIDFAGPLWQQSSGDVRREAALASFVATAKRINGLGLFDFTPASAKALLVAFAGLRFLEVWAILPGEQDEDADELPQAVAALESLQRLWVTPVFTASMDLPAWWKQQWKASIRTLRLRLDSFKVDHLNLLKALSPNLGQLNLGFDKLEADLDSSTLFDLPASGDSATDASRPKTAAFSALVDLKLSGPLQYLHKSLSTLFRAAPLRNIFILVSSASQHGYDPTTAFPLLPSSSAFFELLTKGFPNAHTVEIGDAWWLDAHSATISRGLTVACRELGIVRIRRDEWDPIGFSRIAPEATRTARDDDVELEFAYCSVSATLDFARGLLDAAKARGDRAGINDVGMLMSPMRARRNLEWD